MSIELVNVSRWYGNVVAVNDVTMSIGPGVTGLLGPNGAGKSTIMHMIAGFLPPSRGELTIGGASGGIGGVVPPEPAPPAGTAGVTRISTEPSAWSPSGTRCTRS